MCRRRSTLEKGLNIVTTTAELIKKFIRNGELIDEEEWRVLYKYLYDKNKGSPIFEFLYKHPLVDLGEIFEITGLGLSEKEFEWLGQNPIWPILFESDGHVQNMVRRNAYKLLGVTISNAVKNSSDPKQKIISASNSWVEWMSGRFSHHNKEETSEIFSYLMQTFPNLKRNYQDEEYFQVEDDIGNLLHCYKFDSDIAKNQALFRLCFLLEETFLIPHRGHLLSFLEMP